MKLLMMRRRLAGPNVVPISARFFIEGTCHLGDTCGADPLHSQILQKKAIEEVYTQNQRCMLYMTRQLSFEMVLIALSFLATSVTAKVHICVAPWQLHL